MSGCYGPPTWRDLSPTALMQATAPVVVSVHPNGKGPVKLYTLTLAEREAALSCFEEVNDA